MSSRQNEFRGARGAGLLTVALLLGATLLRPGVCTGSEITTDTAPPPPQAEHAPPPRDGYVWGAGHWEWNGRSYVWVSGTWILARRSAHWISASWEQSGSQWHYIAGHWER
jgi:hypothetical protein